MNEIYFSGVGMEAQQLRVKAQNRNVKETGKKLEDEVDGDASVWHDNFGFEQGQRDLERESTRLRDLTVALSRAQVIDIVEQSERVAIGTTVVVELEDESQREITIGAYGESLPAKGLITYQTPWARALIGKQNGDEVVINLPGEKQEVCIEEIHPPSYKYRTLVAEVLAYLKSE